MIASANLASGRIVEDLKLGLELAANGHPPIFCPSARVTSQFAPSARAAATQRERWERGHLGLIFTAAAQLSYQAITQQNWKLLALTLDLMVPPLSFLALLLVGTFMIALVYALLAFSSLPLVVSSTTILAFLFAIFLAWLRCGRDVVPAAAICSLLPYIVRKLGIYRSVIFSRSDVRWIRTDRTKPD